MILSWQEHIGSAIVHVLDLIAGKAYTVVADLPRPIQSGDVVIAK